MATRRATHRVDARLGIEGARESAQPSPCELRSDLMPQSYDDAGDRLEAALFGPIGTAVASTGGTP